MEVLSMYKVMQRVGEFEEVYVGEFETLGQCQYAVELLWGILQKTSEIQKVHFCALDCNGKMVVCWMFGR